MRPDRRKTLEQLRDEWVDCTKCSLGVQRQTPMFRDMGAPKMQEGRFCFGSGVQHSVLFVGEGPGADEDIEGECFVGAPGQLLRSVLKQLQFRDFYLTNLVACRSCTARLEDDGEQKTLSRRTEHGRVAVPLFADESPPKDAQAACWPRLMEQIYLVDPIVVVALGAEVASALRGKKVSILDERGTSFYVQVPGASERAVLTDKRQAWARTVKGKVYLPTQPNTVSYLVVPTLHPAYVLRKCADQSDNSEMNHFTQDVHSAIEIYQQYRLYGWGVEPQPLQEEQEIA